MYSVADTGELRIRQLGYKQELRRNFTVLSNASIGFTVISVLTGITGKPPPQTGCSLMYLCAQQQPICRQNHFTCLHACLALQHCVALQVQQQPPSKV